MSRRVYREFGGHVCVACGESQYSRQCLCRGWDQSADLTAAEAALEIGNAALKKIKKLTVLGQVSHKCYKHPFK